MVQTDCCSLFIHQTCRILFAISCRVATDFILVPAVLGGAVISIAKSEEQARVKQERVEKDSDFCRACLAVD